jgi:hypothetical protein
VALHGTRAPNRMASITVQSIPITQRSICGACKPRSSLSRAANRSLGVADPFKPNTTSAKTSLFVPAPCSLHCSGPMSQSTIKLRRFTHGCACRGQANGRSRSFPFPAFNHPTPRNPLMPTPALTLTQLRANAQTFIQKQRLRRSMCIVRRRVFRTTTKTRWIRSLPPPSQSP